MREHEPLSERLAGEVIPATEAAKLLGITRQAMYYAIERGRVKCFKAGRAFFPVLASVIQYGMASRRPKTKREAFAQKLRENNILEGDQWKPLSQVSSSSVLLR
jgi:hypothetical protein